MSIDRHILEFSKQFNPVDWLNIYSAYYTEITIFRELLS